MVRHLRIAREIVAGGVEAVEPLLRAVVDKIVEGHRAGAQGLVERIGIEAEPDPGATGARDPALGGDALGRADPTASIAAVLSAPDMKRRRDSGLFTGTSWCGGRHHTAQTSSELARPARGGRSESVMLVTPEADGNPGKGESTERGTPGSTRAPGRAQRDGTKLSRPRSPPTRAARCQA